MIHEVEKTEEEWRKILTRKQYHVLREKGTEFAFANEYWNNKKKGKYQCAGCGNLLFSSEDKYDSGTGWPSFSKPVSEEKVEYETDIALGMERTEVHCSRCGGHLGHVFDDGPKPTGRRFCMNSTSLKFEEDK
ncbi:MAG: peptide-methionine (R)-S-oxide reductase MsrB [Methanomassiliicoccales archaeon]|nr:peptide-methionine (R)-S-oxide reductase MsrB [Methanomassiliicoccales archaeon]NYT15389.1 peptide-methionine (R)-S-oxide reductase MsrB [Methanomassiliicoccales archaeon]